MKRDYHLLIIDPQNDFCDLPAPYVTGQSRPTLAVPGAHADLRRVAELIDKGGPGWTGISVTLDSHHRLDIAHPTFWTTGDGGEVAPFTEITAAQVRAGQYRPRDPAASGRTLTYLDRLEAAGRYRLMVWPVHCEIGSWGHAVHADVQSALARWEDGGLNTVNAVIKGTNPWTEHYSAILAEVPDDDDPSTQLNTGFVALLASAERVYICGEASSHCVKATTEHLVEHLPPGHASKLVLLTDCMSPVTGFDAQHRQFIDAMAARGVRTATAAQVLPEIVANGAHYARNDGPP